MESNSPLSDKAAGGVGYVGAHLDPIDFMQKEDSGVGKFIAP